MRYLPNSPAERKTMLTEIGAASIDDLFAVIPAEYRLSRDLAVPRAYAESEIIDYFRAAGAKNATDFTSFLGAGAYRHYRPVIIDALIQRGEFLTSYTPYQAEITQGTLQAIFEFQTMIAELTGMDVANASMYDGSTGAAEAVMMAVRVTGRHQAVIASTVHPEYREVLHTYTLHQDLPTALVGYDRKTGRIDLAALVQLPGVCQEPRDESDEIARHGNAIRELTNTAIDKLIGMRQREGRSLCADLLRHVQTINENLAAVEQRAPFVIEDYHKRLSQRVNELVSKAQLKVDESDLIKEIAIYAERADIAEEITRLTSHLEAFEHSCNGSDHAGRKLDFIAQEMLREANTIASKANDAVIATRIVEIKGAIDRLKEQVQNVE